MQGARWRFWLTDSDVRRWYENMERGSPLMADETIRVLYRFLNHERIKILRLTPKRLVEAARKDPAAIEDQLMDFVAALEKEGKSPSYTLRYIQAVRSWLAYNGIHLSRRIKVRDAGATPSLEGQRVPRPEEVRDILWNASRRGRVIVALMAYAGLRPEVIGNYSGRDGLRLSDLPEMRFGSGGIQFDRIPTRVVVRRGLSKRRHQYFSFLPGPACEFLRAYLERRHASGEILTAESPVVRASSTPRTPKGQTLPASFVSSRNVSREVRQAMRPRFSWRPYVLRMYFDSRLLLAESLARMPHAYRMFLMGHKGDVDARYTTNQMQPPTELIEDLRRAFRASEDTLLADPSRPGDAREALLRSWREQAQDLGIDPLKVRLDPD